jgi:hypothetical protein
MMNNFMRTFDKLYKSLNLNSMSESHLVVLSWSDDSPSSSEDALTHPLTEAERENLHIGQDSAFEATNFATDNPMEDVGYNETCNSVRATSCELVFSYPRGQEKVADCIQDTSKTTTKNDALLIRMVGGKVDNIQSETSSAEKSRSCGPEAAGSWGEADGHVAEAGRLWVEAGSTYEEAGDHWRVEDEMSQLVDLDLRGISGTIV